MLFSLNQAPPPESGIAPIVIPVFKWVVVNVGSWIAIDWAIGELTDTEEEAIASAGPEGPLKATDGYRKQSLQQLNALETRGKKMLGGKRLALYLALVADARKAIANDPELTIADASAFRTSLFRYTVKHGNCDVFPSERAYCEQYKKKWPGTVTASEEAGPATAGKNKRTQKSQSSTAAMSRPEVQTQSSAGLIGLAAIVGLVSLYYFTR